MIPAPLDITIRRGDTFRLFFRLRNKLPDGTPGDYSDLTAWGTGLAQVRATTDAAVLVEMTVTKANQVTYPGGILLSIPDDVTALLDLPSGCKWDFEITNNLGETDTYLEGAVTFKKDYSRPVGP
jgi:hypothetical protein